MSEERRTKNAEPRKRGTGTTSRKRRKVAADVPIGGATEGSGMQSIPEKDSRESAAPLPVRPIPVADAPSAARRSAATEDQRSAQEDVPVVALPPPMETSAATLPGDAQPQADDESEPAPEYGEDAKGNPVRLFGHVDLPNETRLQYAHRIAREATARSRAEASRQAAMEPPPRRNPLFRLPEKERDWLFQTLRECDFDGVVKAKLAKDGMPNVTDAELKQFFTSEANSQVSRRTGRAAIAANALVNYVEENDVEFSKPLLQALGQEAFRQISGQHADPDALKRLTELFLKARADERSEQLMDIRREKLQLEQRTHTEAALEAFAGEIEKHPGARAAFEALRAELLRGEEDEE